MKDFFISYNSQDRTWAEWIAWTLEEAGYSTVIQAWDFRPGGNFVLAMQQAATDTRQTVAVLSQHYLNAEYTQPEWADALRRDPQGNQRTLLPVRIDNCRPTGLLGSVIYVDLYGLEQDAARRGLLEALNARGKPDRAPAFPGGGTQRESEPAERSAAASAAPTQTVTPLDWQRLTGRQLAALQDALLQAFNRSTLAQMLTFQMNVRLDEIAGQSNMQEVVFDLLQWATSHGRAEELYKAARTANPGNEPLRAFAAEFHRLDAPPTVAGSADGPPRDTTAGERGVAVGGSVHGSVIVTGDGNQINLPPGGASFPGSTPNTGRSALAIWREKLDFLRAQEAITADAAQKFALAKQIAEAEAKIRALS